MTQFVTARDGTRIAYAAEGAGPPLLLLHSLPGSGADWRAYGYVAALSGRFTVVTMDARGFGESDKPLDPDAYSEEHILGDTLAVMDAVSSAPFTLWGHSYGATIARQLAASSPRVGRAILAGTHFGQTWDSQRVADAWASLSPMMLAQAAPDPMAALAALGVPEDERAELLHTPARTTLVTIEGLEFWRPVQPADLRCPALVMVGSREVRVLNALNAQRDAIDAAGITVAVLDGLDHDQLISARDAVLPVALQFLEGK